MKLFGEEVNHTSTNSPLNIIQVENFEEIFFGVFEVELNEQKYPLEKISDYKGHPVVQIPIIVEGEEVLYPFVLIKGQSEILFNESNIELPIDHEDFVLETDNIDEDTLSESKQEILEQIERAKEEARKAIKRAKILEANELSSESKKNNKLLKNVLEKARESLVSEFTNISDKLKGEILKEYSNNYYELKDGFDNRASDIKEDLKLELKKDFKNASLIFDTKIKSLIKRLYNESVYPKLEKDLNEIALQIVEKVSSIESNLEGKLGSKAEKTLVEGVSKELSVIQKANIELNDSINKGVNKALSRAGNVKTLVEKIDKEINEKIESQLSDIEKYFDERIVNIQEKTFDVTEESRKYIIDLVNKSKMDLLEEIKKIPKEKPVEYILESKKKDPEKVNLDKLKKEYDTIIHNKFENYKTDLRKYIAVYSGGGSVAQQFADGGMMNGDLTVVGTISASNYLGITVGGGGSDVSTLSGNWQNTYTTVQSNSASWINPPMNYLSLSGGTVTGGLSVTNNLTVDSNTLFVDSVNNRVGIGTTAPATTCHIVNTDVVGGEKVALRITGGFGSTDFYGTHFSIANINLVGSQTLYVGRGGGGLSVGFYAGSNITSKFAVNGNAVIGTNYTVLPAPTNGAIIEGNVGIGTFSPTSKLDVNGTFNVSGNATLLGTTTASGKMTANNQGSSEALGENDLATRLLAAYEMMMSGNQFGQLTLVNSQNQGSGANAGVHLLGMHASVGTAANSCASAYTYDSFHTHNGFSGNNLRNNVELDAFFHGVMFRVESTSNWVARINFGVVPSTGAIRVPPLAGVAAASGRQWGVEFYYNGVNHVGRLYWYDTSMNYGTPFIVPNLTTDNWPNMVYSIRMRQTAAGSLEIYINSPTSANGGGRLPATPTSTVTATWTNINYGGRHINFEFASALAAGLGPGGGRIHATRMFCKYN